MTTAPSAPTLRGAAAASGVQIKGGLRYGQTVKVSRGTWNRTRRATASSGSAARPRSPAPPPDLPARRGRRGQADSRRGSTSRSAATTGRRSPTAPRARRLPRAGPPHGHLPHRDPRRASPRSVREFARLAAQTYADPRGWRNAGVAFKRVQRPVGLLAGAGRGELAAALLERVQRAVELPRRPLRGDQPDPLEVRLAVVERRGQEPARLPPPRGQPRDRPLARPRPPRLPRSRAAGAGDDAAVQGARRLPPQPVAARAAELWSAAEPGETRLTVSTLLARARGLDHRSGAAKTSRSWAASSSLWGMAGRPSTSRTRLPTSPLRTGWRGGGVADAAGAGVGVRRVEVVEVGAGGDSGTPDQERDAVVGVEPRVGVAAAEAAVVGGHHDERVVARLGGLADASRAPGR